MTRAGFAAALRENLAGMPVSAIDDIVSDYETHFADGVAAGRSEEEISAALGDPARLARELRAEAGLQRWEKRRTPANAVAAVFALIGLGAIDIIILLPLLLTLFGLLLGSFFWNVAIFIGGILVLGFGPFAGGPGGPVAAILFGFGMIGAAVCFAAILTLVTIGLVNAIVWYARLHYRALKLADQS